MRIPSSLLALFALLCAFAGAASFAAAAEAPCQIAPAAGGVEQSRRYLRIQLPEGAKVKDQHSPDSFAFEIAMQDRTLLLDYGLGSLIERKLKVASRRCEMTINQKRSVLGIYKDKEGVHAEGYVYETRTDDFRGYLRASSSSPDRLAKVLGVTCPPDLVRT